MSLKCPDVAHLFYRLGMPITEKINVNGIKWVDVVDPGVEEMSQLSLEFHLNEHTVKDCLEPEHLPKYEFDEENGVHFLILRYIAHAADKRISSIQELTNKIAIFFTDQTVITIHKTETPFLEIIARRAGKKSGSATELVTKIIWQALESFDDPAARLSEQLDFYENHVMLKKTSDEIIQALFYVKRQASLSQKVLLLMQEPINHIRVHAGEEMLIQDVKDQHLKMLTLYNQCLDGVNNLLTISMSFSAQKTNEVVRVLTVFSVFFMPLTFIVGIYGMNFDFMPELTEKWGYPAVLIFMAIVTAMIYFWFKRKKWL